MSKASKRPRVVDEVEKVVPNEELLCVICTELVRDARQATCCGSLYCKACIEKWLTGKVDGSCPNCRSSLEIKNLVVDKRSELQAAAHPRNCQFYVRGCRFVGGRRDVATHERTCTSNPSACSNEHCLTLRSRDLERRQQIARLEKDHKKQLLASVWRTREDNLQNLYGLGCAKVFYINNFERSSHTLAFRSGAIGYNCRIELKHFNVSIICYPDYAADLTDPPRSYVFVLIHPSDPALNREVSIYAVASAGNYAVMQGGNANWMTTREFEAFSIDGKFAFGVK
eukprot:gene13995-16091_t